VTIKYSAGSPQTTLRGVASSIARPLARGGQYRRVKVAGINASMMDRPSTRARSMSVNAHKSSEHVIARRYETRGAVRRIQSSAHRAHATSSAR
jgi:hypothetical protein